MNKALLLLLITILVVQTVFSCQTLQGQIKTQDIDVSTGLLVNDIWPWTGTPAFVRPMRGGVLLVWSDGKGSSYVRRLTLSGNRFQQQGNDWKLPYESCRDIVSMPDGGAIYLGVRDEPQIHDVGAKFCKDPVKNPNGASCSRVDVVRINSDGRTLWSTLLTLPRRVDDPPSQFIWWYGNFMRMSYNPVNNVVAVIMETAGMDNFKAIHQGETGRFVMAADGRLLDNPRFGACAHSSDVRIDYQSQSNKFGSFCFSDNINTGFHMTVTDHLGARTDATMWNSSTVNAKNGYMGAVVADPTPSSGAWWTIFSFPEEDRERAPNNVQLTHVNSAGKLDRRLNLASARGVDEKRPFLAAFGKKREHLLAGWSTGDNTFHMQVLSAATGGHVTSSQRVSGFALPIGRDWITLENGDVAFVWVTPANKLQLTRVLSC